MPAHLRRQTLAKREKEAKDAEEASKKEAAAKEVKKTPKRKVPEVLEKKARDPKKKTV